MLPSESNTRKHEHEYDSKIPVIRCAGQPNALLVEKARSCTHTWDDSQRHDFKLITALTATATEQHVGVRTAWTREGGEARYGVAETVISHCFPPRLVTYQLEVCWKLT